LIPLKRLSLRSGEDPGDGALLTTGIVFGGDDCVGGGGGRFFEGGGFEISRLSTSVLSVVPLVCVVDGIELEKVRLEKLLESDWRGKADLDLPSKWKSSKTKP
jgi:hypothetical protein